MSGNQLWMAARQGASWGAPFAISELNDLGNNHGPVFTADGGSIYFASERAGMTRLYTSTFDGAIFGPPALVPGLETETILQPYVSADELELFGQTVLDRIVRTTRASITDAWDPSAVVTEVDDGRENGWMSLTPDELTLYFEKIMPTGRDIYRASRPSRDQPFGPATAVAELNSTNNDGDPEVTRDGRTMFMSSDRSGISFDIYISSCVD